MNLGELDRLPRECGEAYRLALNVKPIIPQNLRKVVVVASDLGMWGEKILCDLLFKEARLPLMSFRGEDIPAYVGSDTLVVVFDAPTWHNVAEDILAHCTEAEASMLFISHEAISVRDPSVRGNVVTFRLPARLHTLRDARYSFVPAFAILAGIRELDITQADFTEPEAVMTRLDWVMGPNIHPDVNQARRISDCLAGKAVFIYGTANMTAGVAMRWKEQIRKATGQLVAAYELPDVIVNEPSLPFPDLAVERQMLFLRDPDEHNGMRRKFHELAQANKNLIPEVIEICGEGTSQLARVCSLAYIGDFVTAYLALKKDRPI